jgi:hypothetical protein
MELHRGAHPTAARANVVAQSAVALESAAERPAGELPFGQ